MLRPLPATFDPLRDPRTSQLVTAARRYIRCDRVAAAQRLYLPNWEAGVDLHTAAAALVTLGGAQAGRSAGGQYGSTSCCAHVAV